MEGVIIELSDLSGSRAWDYFIYKYLRKTISEEYADNIGIVPVFTEKGLDFFTDDDLISNAGPSGDYHQGTIDVLKHLIDTSISSHIYFSLRIILANRFNSDQPIGHNNLLILDKNTKEILRVDSSGRTTATFYREDIMQLDSHLAMLAEDLGQYKYVTPEERSCPRGIGYMETLCTSSLRTPSRGLCSTWGALLVLEWVKSKKTVAETEHRLYNKFIQRRDCTILHALYSIVEGIASCILEMYPELRPYIMAESTTPRDHKARVEYIRKYITQGGQQEASNENEI